MWHWALCFLVVGALVGARIQTVLLPSCCPMETTRIYKEEPGKYVLFVACEEEERANEVQREMQEWEGRRTHK